ncbi:MAG: UDP-N-acetylglucosamine 2-epimerase (non-hydrolyzing) [Marinilabiliales bacterium]|nr:MAG: UDP-N-acetylglucosamine 2-epimerase (non-hydrolyzing) [Marinilabiliales bacterium]
MLVDLIAGARPNFMKISPIIDAIHSVRDKGADIGYRLVHTGQHYDINMSTSFFEQLGIPDPDINLGAGGGTQAEQTSAIMLGYEKLLLQRKPDICIVVGDVTSTMACSVVARKMHVEVAHVEGGIRSGDWSMPEEINRVVTDSISNYFFTTSEIANDNLRKSGVTDDRIFFVGNTMIDSLLKHRPRFQKPPVWDDRFLEEGKYFVMTLHRPANVDEEHKLKDLINEILAHSGELPVVFPVHPRTMKSLNKMGLKHERLVTVEPLGYLEFNFLVERSFAVITDSGGITEETTVMGVPCMTLRDSTERPETVTIGTNELLGINPEAIKPAMARLFSGNWKKGSVPNLWDGNTASRIVEALLKLKDCEIR